MITTESRDADKVYQDYLELREQKEHIFWREAELLYLLMRRGMWKEIEEGVKSKSEMVREYIGLPTSTMNFKVGLWRTYRVRYDIPLELLEEKSTNKLAKLIPTFEGKKRAEVLKLVKKI